MFRSLLYFPQRLVRDHIGDKMLFHIAVSEIEDLVTT